MAGRHKLDVAKRADVVERYNDFAERHKQDVAKRADVAERYNNFRSVSMSKS